MVTRARTEPSEPDRLADERGALTQQLDFHRATLLRKLEGLDAESLVRPMTASGLSLLGLVRHLTQTEHAWFLNTFAGLPDPEPYPADGGDDDFRVAHDETYDGLVEDYLQTCERARAVVAAAELDDVVTTRGGEAINLRAIVLHMIQETARHNGHADIIREAIDGETGH